jgi:four helix bundle protein
MAEKYDLQERLVAFACRLMEVSALLPKTTTGNYLSGQLVRSGNSASLNYAEVQGAESRKDFIHKLGVVLKELKECRAALQTIIRSKLIQPVEQLEPDLNETEQLVAIIGKSISTAQKNGLLKGRKPPHDT